MNKTYKIVKAFQKDNTLRASYQQLAKEIHGIDFEDWYQNGYWKDNYIPYSVVEGAQILANVAASPMEFIFKNETYHLLQLGTVMTDEGYRNQGLIRELMLKVEEDFKDWADGYFLFANDSVLDFYPKFRYRVTDEFVSVKQINESDLKKLDPFPMEFNNLNASNMQYRLKKVLLENKADRFNLEKAIRSSAANAQIELRNKVELAMFYLTKYMQNDIYYSAKNDAYIIAEILSSKLYIHAIYANRVVDLQLIIEDFMEDFSYLEFIELGFTPKQDELFQVHLLKEENLTLFTKGTFFDRFEEDHLRIPIMAHT